MFMFYSIINNNHSLHQLYSFNHALLRLTRALLSSQITLFLSKVKSLLLFWYLGHLLAGKLDLFCKGLNKAIHTCIFYNFFFFSSHSSPPMFAPSPPSFTKALSFFFSKDLLE